MAIVERQPGEARGAAQAGAEIGKAEARRRSEAQTLQIAAEQRAKEWELEKMQIRSQQEFAHEIRLQQAQLDAEARAKEWEVEKMELRSRIDFEAEEKARRQRMEMGQNRLAAINKAIERGEFSPDDPRIDMWKMYYKDLAETGETGPTSLYLPRTTKEGTTLIEDERKVYESIYGRQIANESSIMELRDQFKKDFPDQPLPGQSATVQAETPSDERVLVRSPDGTPGTLLRSELGKPEFAGYTQISSPVKESPETASTPWTAPIWDMLAKVSVHPEEIQARGEVLAEKKYGKRGAKQERFAPMPTFWEQVKGRLGF